MLSIQRVNFIGPGKVGQTLMRRLVIAGGDFEIGDILGRNVASAASARAFAAGGNDVASLAQMRSADVWLLTVPDGEIEAVAASLAEQGHAPATAVHCSGFHPSSCLGALAAHGWQVASAHPVLSFADPARAAEQFTGCLCGVEGTAAGVTTRLFETMGARIFPVRTEAKALYHAAAVISNNFTTVLQALAQDAWRDAGVPEAVIGDLHAALLRGTVENVLAEGPQGALTGPAARGDTAVVTAQAAEVAAWNAQAGEVYRLLSEMAARLKTTGRA